MTSETLKLLPLPSDASTLIRRADLPSYLPVSNQTLARWSHEGIGPKYFKIGGKLVAYRAGDVLDWLNENQRENTSQG